MPKRLILRSVSAPTGRPTSRNDTRRLAGFSLLELTVVIVIVAFMVTIAIARLMALYADAERVSMETVAGTLRSALGMKVAESIVRHELATLPAMEGSNPMDRLAEPPKNYLGAFDKPDPAQLEDGNWYFDKGEGTVVYLVRSTSRFAGGLPNPPRARFKVRLVYKDTNGNGKYDAGVDAAEGLRLSAVEPYQWTK